jgi:hypothetical protein
VPGATAASVVRSWSSVVATLPPLLVLRAV